jgi:alpha-beta hydrolase superfamily lysophospholipase
VIYIHGIQSHGGWYGHSCRRLCEAGYAVDFLERRGCGLNTAHRGDAPTFRRLLDDIGEFVKALPADGLPRFLVAVSWGGKLGVGVTYRHPGLLDGLAMLCPGLFPKVDVPLPRKFRTALAAAVKPGKFFPIPLAEPDLFTATPDRQRFIADDPQALREATARFFFQNFMMVLFLRRAGHALDIPVLLMLGEKDRIIDNGRTWQYLDGFPAADKEVRVYTGSHHTLEFEPDPEGFIRDLIGWLDRRTRADTMGNNPHSPAEPERHS